MKIQAITATALLFITAYAYAQQSPTPESFVQQIETNVAQLEGWKKVYAREHGFRKVGVYTPTAQSVDVVRSDSVLRPYVGKLHFFIAFAHGDYFETKEQAEASAAYSGSGTLSSHECFMDFSPNKTAWEITKIQCRTTFSRRLIELDRADMAGTPLGDVVQVLESARATLRQKQSPKKKET